MLEHLPRWLGAMLKNDRAGHARLTIVRQDVGLGDDFIDLSSPAFANGDAIPERFTADGEGISPPLVWDGVPAGTAGFALLVEDADAPTPNPLVHALVWNLPPGARSLPEAAIAADGKQSADGSDVGRNSYFAQGWLPPDPPPGHGTHDYVFQLFALSDIPDVGANPGRAEFARAISGRILAAGMLVGTYARGETAK